MCARDREKKQKTAKEKQTETKIAEKLKSSRALLSHLAQTLNVPEIALRKNISAICLIELFSSQFSILAASLNDMIVINRTRKTLITEPKKKNVYK